MNKYYSVNLYALPLKVVNKLSCVHIYASKYRLLISGLLKIYFLLLGVTSVYAQQCVHFNGYGTGGPYSSASAALTQHCSSIGNDWGCFLVDGGASENEAGASAGGTCMCPDRKSVV